MTAVYELPEEHQDLRATIRLLAREQVAPRAAAIDAADEYPWDIRRLLADQDVLALPFEPEFGGTGTGAEPGLTFEQRPGMLVYTIEP